MKNVTQTLHYVLFVKLHHINFVRSSLSGYLYFLIYHLIINNLTGVQSLKMDRGIFLNFSYDSHMLEYVDTIVIAYLKTICTILE